MLLLSKQLSIVLSVYLSVKKFFVVAAIAVCRWYSAKKEESEQEFDARWEAYFNRSDIDAWELRRGLNELYGHDLVPEPKIVSAMLRAARRVNDVAVAIRVIEAVKSKCAGDKEMYSYVLNGVKPTIQELGLKTPEELGLA